jgi:DNA-directed RNA polymerase subunit beta'
VLEEVIKEHPVFLNRAPTLHRLGIQAFEPVLVEGKAIQIHPLVCAAFNADFDGDQMAVHLPLSAEAQAEARLLMLSAHNILSPAHGRPIAVPSQDMIIGAFYLTEIVTEARGAGRVFSTLEEARMAHETRDETGEPEVSVHAPIRVRMPAGRFPVEEYPARQQWDDATGEWADDPAGDGSIVIRRIGTNGSTSVMVETTLGRLLFNEAFPPTFTFQNRVVKKRDITDIAGLLVDQYTKSEVAASLDRLKELGFEYSTRAGLTISIADVRTPLAKAAILDKHEKEAEKVEQQYDRGIITDDERRQKEVEIWTDATNQVTEAMLLEQKAEQFNPIEMMVGSGARGNVMQVRQIAGMRGLVANPRGEIIPRPIKSNFREGLSVLEYFISTHGARKGLADTALRTADSGYLTRRLVDVAQELIVRDEDCGSTRGIWIENITNDPDHVRFMETSLLSRVLSEDVTLADGSIMPRNTEVTEEVMEVLIEDAAVTRLRVRSVLTCEYPRHLAAEVDAAVVEGDVMDEKYRAGICSFCYGTMLATGKIVDLGEAIGIIAAQSIGEPGTQLTMRTFHTGGVAGEDITHGLPRVVELFEARTPKGAAVLAESSGVVRIGENEKGERTLTVVADDGEEEIHAVSMRTHLAPGIVDGAEVIAGAQLTGDVKSSRDPKKILDIEGIRATQQYLVDQVQKVYREQGVSIHDKHVEVIVRQMLRRVGVSDPGDSVFLPGQKADAREFANVNKRLVTEGKRPAEGRPELMGITKASLATESWLSAASFQETTRVLTEAAIEGKNDGLEGLKENVIIGKLIPAGTGMPRYRDVGTSAPDYQPMEYYSSDEDALELAERLRASLDTRSEALDTSFLVPSVATDPFAVPAGGLSVVPDPVVEAETAGSESGEAASGE